MSDEQGQATSEAPAKTKKKSGKRKANGEPRAARVNFIANKFGERGAVAAKAYFSAHKDEKKELMAALRAESKAADPEKVKKLQARIAKAQAALAAATDSASVIEKYRAKLVSIAHTIYGDAEAEVTQ